MVYLLLSVLSSSLIFVIFRWIGIRKIDTFQVIIVNYLTASLFGFFVFGNGLDVQAICQFESLTGVMLLGISFVVVFNLMAVTTQQNGTSTAVVATKMSLVVPVVYAFIVYGDDISYLKIAGVLTAIAGVYLAVMKPSSVEQKSILLPILLFISSGFIDIAIKHLSHGITGTKDQDLLIPTIFLFAFITGSIWLVIKSFTSKVRWNLSLLLSGIALGLINFFSIYFLVMALELKTLQSSVIFPLNNISIVLLSTFFGILLFKEKLNNSNKVGILFSVLAILLMFLSK